MHAVKPDAEEIGRFLRELQSAEWISGPIAKWPKYVYHFTNIDNAVAILNDGCLLSRAAVESANELETDSASTSVLDHTEDWVKEYVRLYFRPKTPTQYCNEGIRPVNKLYEPGVHCPVPVFFLFDSYKVLSMRETRFSNGNLAAGADFGDDATFLKQIPFEKVFHDGPLQNEQKKEIIYRRHAEVVVPNQLRLDNLKWIVCRSEAESQTLKHLLSPSLKRKWIDRIVVDSRRAFFFCYWTFIEKILPSNNAFVIVFNEPNGPFDVSILLTAIGTGKEYTYRRHFEKLNEKLRLSLNKVDAPDGFNLEVRLDNNLACSVDWLPEEFPF